MLNGIWLSFFIAAFAASLWQWLVGGDSEVFARLVQSLFDMARVSVDIILVLLGTMTLWLGFLSIAEKAGLIRLLGRVLDPLFCRLMPEVPRGHPAMGLISMNFAANILGLDNAATPIGIKAMHSLQTLNPSRETASNAQILFLVLNTSSLTLLPVTIFMYRAQQGAADPTLVFLPILLATTASSLVGLLAVAVMQRLKLWQPVVLAYLVAGALALGLLLTTLAGMSAQALAAASTLVGNLTLFSIVMMFLVVGALRGVRVYDAFIEGAKEGLKIYHYPTALPDCHAGSRGCTARQRRVGCRFKRYPLVGRRRWLGHPLCGCPAHRVCETAFRQRCPRHDDRNHGHLRRRQLRRAARGHHAGQHRNHLLRAGGLLRRCGYYPYPPRFGLRFNRRRGRHAHRNCRVLLVFWLALFQTRPDNSDN